jgi:hypothetical protein
VVCGRDPLEARGGSGVVGVAVGMVDFGEAVEASERAALARWNGEVERRERTF